MTELDQDTLLFYAFRYAIACQTYVINEIIELLIQHKDILSTYHRFRIVSEIRCALENDMISMDCDIKQWKKLLGVLEDAQCS